MRDVDSRVSVVGGLIDGVLVVCVGVGVFGSCLTRRVAMAPIRPVSDQLQGHHPPTTAHSHQRSGIRNRTQYTL